MVRIDRYSSVETVERVGVERVGDMTSFVRLGNSNCNRFMRLSILLIFKLIKGCAVNRKIARRRPMMCPILYIR